MQDSKPTPSWNIHSYPHVSRKVPCDACQGSEFRLISDCDRRGQALRTLLCCDCGLVSHADLPEASTLRTYYTTQYRAHYHGSRIPKPHRVIRAWQAGQYYLRLLQPHLPPQAHVCEIGAGLGGTVKAFSDAGFRAWGIEPGQEFLDYARQRLHADVRHGCWEDIPTGQGLDVVLLIHVIEHLRSPRAALQHIRSLLHGDGYLYVECPNLAAPHSAPNRCFHGAHVYNFTPETLTTLAQACGFRVERAFHPGGHVSVLLRPDEPQRNFVPGAAERTLRGMHRYSRWGYYVRPSYWGKRVSRDYHFLGHRIAAKWRVRRLESQWGGGVLGGSSPFSPEAVRRDQDEAIDAQLLPVHELLSSSPRHSSNLSRV